MKEIIDKIKAMDKAELNEAVEKAKKLAETPEGKDFIRRIKEGKKTPEQEKAIKEIGNDPMISKLIFDILNGKG